jgi:hypothetical protein
MRKGGEYSLLFFVILNGALGLRLQALSEDNATTQRLKERVTQFYAAIQANQWDKASEYVTEKARSAFLSQPRGKIDGFSIAEVKTEEGGKSAVVEAALKVMIPSIFRGVDVPMRTRWKFESGDWFNDISDPPKPLSDKFQKYFYDKQAARSQKSTNPGVPPLQVKFDRDVIDFGVAAKGTTLTLHFPFTNLSSQTIKIEKIYLQPQFTRDGTKKTTFKPGEKGEVIIEVDTSVLLREVDQTIFVELQPIEEMVPLRIKGKVFEAKDLERHKPN